MSGFFNKYYDVLMGPLEKRTFQPIRAQLLSKAKGTVLEIGAGTGVNFPYYRNADKVVATEPEPVMLEKSLSRIDRSGPPIEVIRAGGERLPFPPNTFDTVVGTLVFCTIPDPKAALAEIRRVCKPGGTLLLLEHVRMDGHPLLAKLQDWLTPAWKRMAGGCHLNRDTLRLAEEAGFRAQRVEWQYNKLMVIVEATKPLTGEPL